MKLKKRDEYKTEFERSDPRFQHVTYQIGNMPSRKSMNDFYNKKQQLNRLQDERMFKRMEEFKNNSQGVTNYPYTNPRRP